jgi:2-iminobutanoate/2-iminopropanoate deaminase
MRKAINPPNAPSAIGTYNQGIETDGLVFTSGQVGIDPSTGQLVDGGIDMQAAQTLKNIEVILSSLDLGKESIVKLTVFVKNLDDFPFVNEAFKNFFNGIDYPARSTVEVSELPLGALIEIECIAIK